jgi:hypothetical protein
MHEILMICPGNGANVQLTRLAPIIVLSAEFASPMRAAPPLKPGRDTVV